MRSRNIEAGSWEQEAGSQKWEEGSRKSGVRSLESEAGIWEQEFGSRKFRAGKFRILLAIITISILSACSTGDKSDNENVQSRLSTKELKLFAVGQQLYTNYCINCHMEKGEGLGTLIPPLKNSDYLLNDILGAARTIKFGLRGPITVNGIAYNQPMPANPDMTSFEIQELLVFISNAWGNESKVIPLGEVEDLLQSK